MADSQETSRSETAYIAITLGVAGFLIAILWMDLIFDVQVLRYLSTPNNVPNEILESNRAYYQRVTVDSFPMGALVGAVMCAGLVTNILRLYKSSEHRVRKIASLVLLAIPSVWAVFVIFPNAQRLAAGEDSLEIQSQLAIHIFYGHACCLAFVLGLAAVQFLFRHETSNR